MIVGEEGTSLSVLTETVDDVVLLSQPVAMFLHLVVFRQQSHREAFPVPANGTTGPDAAVSTPFQEGNTREKIIEKRFDIAASEGHKHVLDDTS